MVTLLMKEDEYDQMTKALNPNGDGKASEYIAESLKTYFSTDWCKLEI